MCVHRKRSVAVRGFWSKQASLPSSAFTLLDALKKPLQKPIIPSLSSTFVQQTQLREMYLPAVALYSQFTWKFFCDKITLHTLLIKITFPHTLSYLLLVKRSMSISAQISSSKIPEFCATANLSRHQSDISISISASLSSGLVTPQPIYHLMSISFIPEFSKH